MSNADMDYCRSEFEKRFVDDDELGRLLANHRGICEPDGERAAIMLCDIIEDSLRDRSPLLFLRVGDGEGNAFGLTLPGEHAPPRLRSFVLRFYGHNGVGIPPSEATQFCAEVKDAFVTADVIGFRLFLNNERKAILDAIDRGMEHAALGMTYAREALVRGLSEGWLENKFITSAWLHLNLIPHLDRLLASASAVIVITGRSELQPSFASRLGPRLKEFISVPVQGFRPRSLGQSHFGKDFPEVKKRLEGDLRGVLVLVGAGFFGKVYAATARKSGAVAVDLGSAFDILAGLKTRPVHAAFPCDDYHWITPEPAQK